jgi:hypothetical protein
VPLPTHVLGTPVRHGTVPPTITGGQRLNELVEATDRLVRVETAGVRMLVDGTDEVVVDWDTEADRALLDAMLYGAAARMLLLHGGTFTLHASLVAIGGRAVAIGGSSGAGKSTTTVALATRYGGRLLVDDVLPVDLDPDTGAPMAQPFHRPVHLTDDAHARLELAAVEGPWVGEGDDRKRAVDLAAPDGPVRLDELVVISRATDPTAPAVQVHEVRGAERVRHVVRLANATGLASLGERADPFFAWCTRLAAVLPVRTIERAPDVDTLDAICAEVMVAR